ncbi:hypothetical protein [Solemya elarraichensis gill symbiont]|uniref:Uncharacterized protein n=1 Tax=Solemya elarraichensis gill symbiont TaxID=1918949 RepID=A0A1T2L1K6_9GAMM|nr:hypothetical protein [Solemya elarraichensis gill symbiont]OOZ38900.1 hypothetical protein BOW52_07910 [Solemya elarraichensis gill symbiont]
MDKGWPGFLNLADYLLSLRPRLEDATGRPVRYNWCLRLDPQIEEFFGCADWVLKEHGLLLEKFLEDGDEICVHVHPWRPVQRWFRRTWLADYVDQEWAEHCIRLSHDAFVRHFGRSPSSISMGDFYMSNQIMKLIDELGFRVDSSLYPGMEPVKKLKRSELTRGTLPDCRHVPDRAYKPSVTDFTRPGESHHQVWEVPLSAGRVRHPISGEEVQSSLLLGAMPDWIENIIEKNMQKSSPYLHAGLRTDVRMNADNRERFDWAMGYIEQLGRKHNFQFMTHNEYCDLLDNNDTACAA